MPSFFLVQDPGGSRTFINLDHVACAWFGPAEEAWGPIEGEVEDENDAFLILMAGAEGEQQYFWWQGAAAQVAYEEFQRAAKGQPPLHPVMLPPAEK